MPEKQEYRNDAEYSQQRQDGAENDRASPHDFFSHRVTLVAPGCDFSRQPFRERRSSFDRRKMPLIFCHALTMRCRLAARLFGMFRICVFLCRLRADAGYRQIAMA
jgi:hypothetical protein